MAGRVTNVPYEMLSSMSGVTNPMTKLPVSH